MCIQVYCLLALAAPMLLAVLFYPFPDQVRVLKGSPFSPAHHQQASSISLATMPARSQQGRRSAAPEQLGVWGQGLSAALPGLLLLLDAPPAQVGPQVEAFFG